MATDYSAISRLPANLFSPFNVQARVPGGGAYRGDSSVFQWNEDGTPVMQQAGSGLQMDEAAMRNNPALAAYQTKFSQAEDLGNGTIRARMQQPGADKYALMDVIYKLDPVTGEYVMQGDPNKFKQQSGLTSGLQTLGKAASILAAPYVGGALSGALGGGILGGAASGAAVGGGGALLGGSDSDTALKAAIAGGVTGGAMGGIRDYIGTVDPLSPMEVPSTEWQNVPTGNIDAALNHVSPTLDGAIRGAQHLTPAALESAIGTPGYGINASADAYLEGIGSPNLSGANATVPQEYLMNGNWNASGTIPDSPINPTQTIEVTGNQIDYGDGSAFPTAPATPAPTAPTGGAPIDYGDGSAFPPGDGSAWTAPPAAAPGLGSKIGDFFKANPKLAISLLGSVFGGGSSGGSGSGGAGGIGSQGGMTATQAPKFQRQYVAPPAGYRPGFDPEHKYFTGIGNVGTGG